MEKSEEKLWELYKKTNRKELLEKIVERYLHIVKIITNQLQNYATPNMNKDDLYSAGLIGLLQAIERYDYTKGFEFTTFASQRIRGEIIDEIRRTDWVPRSVRNKLSEINSVIVKLKNKHDYMPTDGEIAEEMNVSLEDYYKYTKSIGPLFLSSLNTKITSGTSGNKKLRLLDTLEDQDQDLDEKTKRLKEIRKTIVDGISELREKEKLVISLYYYEELNLKEIAVLLNVSEARVSQIHSSSLLKLRKIIKSNFRFLNI